MFKIYKKKKKHSRYLIQCPVLLSLIDVTYKVIGLSQTYLCMTDIQWVPKEIITQHQEKVIAKQFKLMLQKNDSGPYWYILQV